MKVLSEINIEKFKPFLAEIEEMKKINNTLVFDYESPKGNKEARSHVYKLRQSRSALEKARKAEKAWSLEYGRKVDAQAKEIDIKIEEMISVHQERLDAIEQREKDRILAHKDALNKIRDFLNHVPQTQSSLLLVALHDLQEVISNGRDWQEFEADFKEASHLALDHLTSTIAESKDREAKEAELEQLRKEKAAREQAERDERIRKEAAEKAKKEAEEKAYKEKLELERQKIAAEERERLAKKAQEEAEKRAIEADRLAKEKAESDLHAKLKAEAEEKEKLEANKKHRKAVILAGLTSIMEIGFSKDDALKVVQAIDAGKIKNVYFDFSKK